MKTAAAGFAFFCLGTAAAQPTALLDFGAPPGANYETAEFRFWCPGSPVRAVAVLVPGSKADGRPRPTGEA